MRIEKVYWRNLNSGPHFDRLYGFLLIDGNLHHDWGEGWLVTIWTEAIRRRGGKSTVPVFDQYPRITWIWRILHFFGIALGPVIVGYLHFEDFRGDDPNLPEYELYHPGISEIIALEELADAD